MKKRHVNKIILHCTASDQLRQTAAMIDSWHKKRGWRKIGYHYFIRKSGLVEGGRYVEEVGSHVRGENANSIGICLAGLNHFSRSQMESLGYLLSILKNVYGEATLHGHKEFNEKKTCPVFDYSTFVKDWEEVEEKVQWLNILKWLWRMAQKLWKRP